MATTEFKVFHGVGAVIAQVTNHTKFFVFAIVDGEKPVDFSVSERRFEVDLEATPSMVGEKNGTAVRLWSEVKFDDRGVDKFGEELPTLLNVRSLPLTITNLGSTTRAEGLRDLTRGGFVGAVYIEHDHYLKIRDSAISLVDTLWPQNAGLALHEVTSVTYSKNDNNGLRAGQRYHGFHGRLIGRATTTDNGEMIKVAIRRPILGGWLGPWWFELENASQCDRDPPATALGHSQSITPGSIETGSEGAFFIALPHAVSLDLSGPKVPIGQG